MKIYILADMEGISGIRMMSQVQAGQPGYDEGCRLMRAEVNVAVDAAFAAGATEVVVADTHGGGGQLALSEMDGRATYELPVPGCMMPFLDASFAGVILLGHHGRAGSGGFLDHTFNSSQWFEFSLGGNVMGEIGVEAAYAGYFGVPVLLVSGDAHTAEEAVRDLGEVETVVTKWALGRNRARCLGVEEAHQLLREGIGRAISDCGKFKPFCPVTPTTARLVVYRTDFADALAQRPGVRRVDARTVEADVPDLRSVRPW